LSNDSKHHTRNCHVLIIPSFDDNGNTEDWCSTPFNPTFRRVCSSVALVKPSNAKKNSEEIIELLGLELAAYYAGGTNDNANDAQREIIDTFNFIMEEVGRSANKSI
jgi:hypothetical protein